MKRKIMNFLGASFLISMIGLSLVQLNTSVVKATGCPSNPFPECNCVLTQYWYYGSNPTHWYCHYHCSCPGGGGGEPFEIERDWEFDEW